LAARNVLLSTSFDAVVTDFGLAGEFKGEAVIKVTVCGFSVLLLSFVIKYVYLCNAGLTEN